MKNVLWAVLVAGFAFLIGAISGADALIFVDVEAVVAELGISALVLFFAGLLKDFFKSFTMLGSKKDFQLAELRRSYESVKLAMFSLCATGLLVFFISLIAIMRDITNLQVIGQNLAVALLVLLYAAILVLILLPLSFRLKVKINDYMSKEE